MSADNASVNSGPTKFETVNWPTANVPPATSTAGQTSTVRRQPVLISVEEGNPNSAQIVFYVGGAQPSDWNSLSDMARIVLLLDGRDEAALASARAAWKEAKANGHDVTYWKETPSGKFEKQN